MTTRFTYRFNNDTTKVENVEIDPDRSFVLDSAAFLIFEGYMKNARIHDLVFYSADGHRIGTHLSSADVANQFGYVLNVEKR